MRKAVYLVAVVVLAGLLSGMFGELHVFGVPQATEMDDYFLARAPLDRSAQNVVTSLVFDFRGFDTLGEAGVLFTALCSIGALFREGGKRE
ncbi:MAG: hypothetical protein LBR61_10860 [Synergistaceae bacterium]|jgi:multisubunit Na+/H+ antiporter MnhB subunit|nr:hypothetical protein [Synergistaceae bacterium]